MLRSLISSRGTFADAMHFSLSVVRALVDIKRSKREDVAEALCQPQLDSTSPAVHMPEVARFMGRLASML